MRLTRRLATSTGKLLWKGTVWMMTAPTEAAVNATRGWAASRLLTDTIPCRNCGTPIRLLGGPWECGECHYTFFGNFFEPCETCGSTPPWVECGVCEASTMNPIFFG